MTTNKPVNPFARKKIDFVVIANNQKVNLPKYAMQNNNTVPDAVEKSIERYSGLQVITWKWEGDDCDGRGFYQYTLGKQMSSGGYDVRAKLVLKF